MAGALSLTVGAATYTVPINMTNANINAAVLRYCTAKGLDTTGLTPTQIGELFLTSVIKVVRDISVDRQRVEEYALLQAGVEAKIAAENNF